MCCPSSPCAYEAAGENKHCSILPDREAASASCQPQKLDRQCLDRWRQRDNVHSRYCHWTLSYCSLISLASARRHSVSTCLILCHHNGRVDSQLLSAQYVFFEVGAIFLTSRILPASVDCSVSCSSSHGWTSWSLSWVPTCEWAERRDESRRKKSPGGLLL